MQSILLSPSSNPQTSECLSDIPAVDKQSQQDEFSQQKGHFSDLLGTAVADSERGNNNLGEADLAEVAELTGEPLPDTLSSAADSEISAEKSVRNSAMQAPLQLQNTVVENELLPENSGIEQPGVDTALTGNSLTVDQEYAGNVQAGQEQSNLKEAAKEYAPQPILAQIEAAQKMDTQLSDPQQLSSDKLVLAEPLRKGQEKGAAEIAQASLPVGSVKLKADVNEKALINGELKNSAVESLKPETEGTLKTTAVDPLIEKEGKAIQDESLQAAVSEKVVINGELKNSAVESLKPETEGTLKTAAVAPLMEKEGKAIKALQGESLQAAVSEKVVINGELKNSTVEPFKPETEGALKTIAVDSLKADVNEKGLINGELKNKLVEPLRPEGEAVLKTTAVDSLIEKDGKAIKAVQDESLKAVVSEKTLKGEALKTEMPLQVADNQNELLSVTNSEIERNVFTHAVESSVLRSTEVNSSGLSKVVNQNMQAAATSSAALQQPLELQEKHAAALLGERVLMMINQGKQEIQIRLDPAELGSMYIKLQVQQEQLQLSIQTEAGQSRDLIEQHLPKLREQLAQQGVSLGETSVEQHGQGKQKNANHQGKNTLQDNVTQLPDDSALQIMDEQVVSRIPLSAQGIDYYA